MVNNTEESMIAHIGMLIAPVFAPLGFGHWHAATALVTGLAGKEVVVSTLAVLTGGGQHELISPSALGQIFTPLSAASFLIFILLYTPCVAAIATMLREIGSVWKIILIMFYEIVIAWLAAFAVYHLGLLFGFQ